MIAATIERLSVQDALARQQAKQALLIDVREANETAAGHAAGATLLPLSEMSQWVAQVAAQGQPVMAICRSGARSLRACQELGERGVAVANVEGGTTAWVAAGLPLDRP